MSPDWTGPDSAPKSKTEIGSLARGFGLDSMGWIFSIQSISYPCHETDKSILVRLPYLMSSVKCESPTVLSFCHTSFSTCRGQFGDLLFRGAQRGETELLRELREAGVGQERHVTQQLVTTVTANTNRSV